MIKINKDKPPKYLETNAVQLAIEKIETFYSSTGREQKRYTFPLNKDIDRELVKYLNKEFYGKCGYCEIKINTNVATVDRYRPNNGVRDKKEYFQDLYWWLTFEWENLIYCCKECNQYKANYFPIKGKRASSDNKEIDKEKPLLVNPCIDYPDQHFIYDMEGNMSADTDEGYQTIELLRLNRMSLVTARQKAGKQISDIIDGLLNHGKKATPKSDIDYLKVIYEDEDPSIEFLAFKKWFLLDELESNYGLKKILDLEEEDYIDINLINKHQDSKNKENTNKDNFIKNDYFPLEYIEIENFKSITKLKINFKDDDIDKKSWLFLLGENGVGKSSILQAIALGLKKNKDVENLKTSSLIQKNKSKATIKIKERNSNNIIETTLIRKDNEINQTGEFNSFLLGYGSLRLSSEDVQLKTIRDLDKISYSNLFNPILALNDITHWLKETHKKNPTLFERVAYAIKQLLPHDYINNELTIVKEEITFKNSEVIFSELSDGFKSTIVLAVDIMMKLTSANADFDKVSGIVIIDELGNQLHPRWQMRIVKQLRDVFPNINFIISTHHPLCLRGSEDKEILLLKNINNEVVLIDELPNPASLRVDQILASEFFGLSSLIDPELEAKFNKYYELLAKEKDINQDERLELDSLKDELRNKKQLGATLREELMYTVIDKLLAQKIVYSAESINRAELKTEVVNRVSEIWKRLNLEEND